jgi:purine-binding chemotaxis protein CheW
MEDSTEVRNRQFLSFHLAGEEYAIEIFRVREIIEYGVVTCVPLTPPWIRGVINLRGGVVPVVDLAVRFNLPVAEVTARTCIVIVEAELGGIATPMGVVADSVSQVLELRTEDIEPPPPFGARIRLEFLLGMAKSDKKFALLLDIDRILSSDELLTLAETTQIDQEAVAGAQPESQEPSSQALA